MRVCSCVMRVSGRIFITAYLKKPQKLMPINFIGTTVCRKIELIRVYATNIGYSIKKTQFVYVSKVYVDIPTKQNILSLILESCQNILVEKKE